MLLIFLIVLGEKAFIQVPKDILLRADLVIVASTI